MKKKRPSVQAVRQTCLDYANLKNMSPDGAGRYKTLANYLAWGDQCSIRMAYDMAVIYSEKWTKNTSGRYHDLVTMISRLLDCEYDECRCRCDCDK